MVLLFNFYGVECFIDFIRFLIHDNLRSFTYRIFKVYDL